MNFSKVSDTIRLKVLIQKLVMYELDGQTVGSIKAKRPGPESGDQWHKVNLEAITSDVPLWSIVEPVLFNIFVSDMDSGTECTLFRFVNGTELCVRLTCWREGCHPEEPGHM